MGMEKCSFLPADARDFDEPQVQNCLLAFSVKAHCNRHSLRIYSFSNKVDLKNSNRVELSLFGES